MKNFLSEIVLALVLAGFATYTLLFNRWTIPDMTQIIYVAWVLLVLSVVDICACSFRFFHLHLRKRTQKTSA